MSHHCMTDSVWDRVELEKPDNVKVSVVVVTYFAGPALWTCVTALKCDEQVDEVVIVINGARPITAKLLEELAQADNRFRIIKGHGNIGFARAANLGAEESTGDRILFLNPDAVLRKGSIAALEMASQGLNAPWIIGGRVFNADGSEQRGGRRCLPGVLSSLATFANLGNIHPRFEGVNHNRLPVPDGPVETEVVSGAMMYLSRESFDILGGFDGDYFLHVEDIDICRRAVEHKNGVVMFTPLAGAMHYSSTSESARVRVEWEKAKGFGRYFRKFSHSPVTKGLAVASVPFIAALLFSRIFLRSVRQHHA